MQLHPLSSSQSPFMFKKLPLPPHPPLQNNNKRIIHIQELLPFLPLLSHPHPQFVAVKSLIIIPPYIDYTSCYAQGLVSVYGGEHFLIKFFLMYF